MNEYIAPISYDSKGNIIFTNRLPKTMQSDDILYLYENKGKRKPKYRIHLKGNHIAQSLDGYTYQGRGTVIKKCVVAHYHEINPLVANYMRFGWEEKGWNGQQYAIHIKDIEEVSLELSEFVSAKNYESENLDFYGINKYRMKKAPTQITRVVKL